MTLEEEAKEFLEKQDPPQPTSYKCNSCCVWSGYIKGGSDIPRGWAEDETGYYCYNCKTKHRRN